MTKSSSFVTHTPVLNIPLPSRLYAILYITNLVLHSHFFTFTFSIPITPSDTEKYLPSDDPNITSLIVSNYDCAKQHNLRQVNILNVKQCTEALQTLNTHVLKPEFMFEQTLSALTLSNMSLMPKRKGGFACKVQLNTVVSIELYGTTIHYRFLLRSIL